MTKLKIQEIDNSRSSNLGKRSGDDSKTNHDPLTLWLKHLNQDQSTSKSCRKTSSSVKIQWLSATELTRKKKLAEAEQQTSLTLTKPKLNSGAMVEESVHSPDLSSQNLVTMQQPGKQTGIGPKTHQVYPPAVDAKLHEQKQEAESAMGTVPTFNCPWFQVK